MNYSIYDIEEKKTSLPTVNGCFHLNIEVTVRIYSFLLIIWYIILNIIYLYVIYDKKYYIPLIVDIIITVSLIIFIIGTYTKKIFLIKQLQYHYPIYLIFSVLNIAQYIIGVFSDESHDMLSEQINEIWPENRFSEFSNNKKETYIKLYQCTYTTIALFMLIVYFYFYIVVYSYIHKIERIIEIQKQQEYSITLARYI